MIKRTGVVFTFCLIISSIFINIFSAENFIESYMFNKVYTHKTSFNQTQNTEEYLWEEFNVFPFNELICSWNAQRPNTGYFTFYVRIKNKNIWSDWIKYAQWGAKIQKSFVIHLDARNSQQDNIKLNIDTLSLQENSLANAFAIKVVTCDGASCESLHEICVSVSNLNKYKKITPSVTLNNVFIKNVPLVSQMALNHPDKKKLCSPTSTSIVLSYILAKLQDINSSVSPLVNADDFADLVYDQNNKIYGNWVLNVAAACDIACGKINGYVKRFNSFTELHEYLTKDIPIVVSIKGPITGGALPYKDGHLLVVTGWKQKTRKVICVDPAFKQNNLTLVYYKLDDFLEAWAKRNNVGYVFTPVY